MSTTYSSLAIQTLDDFIYGRSPRPVMLSNGLTIGGGEVYPELNFTLPGMLVNIETMPEVRRQYAQMIGDAVRRAVELHVPALFTHAPRGAFHFGRVAPRQRSARIPPVEGRGSLVGETLASGRRPAPYSVPL